MQSPLKYSFEYIISNNRLLCNKEYNHYLIYSLITA